MYDLIALRSRLDAVQLMWLDTELKARSKNIALAYVIWFFFGIFGGHRFYMQKKGSAVAMLVLTLSGVGAIASFIWFVIDAFGLHEWVSEDNRMLEYRLITYLLNYPVPPPPFPASF